MRKLIPWLATIVTMTAQAGETYRPPRTADGKPDLQGTWTNASITTLQRDARYKSLVIPPTEVAAATAAHPQVVRQNTDDEADEGTRTLDGSDLARGRGYNAFWIDPGREFGLVKGERRTSWIVDPPAGRIPFTHEGRVAVEQAEALRESYDGPESRPPADRCLFTGGRIGPPMINGLYNNNYQIVQTSDHVLIQVEMVRHARIIPIRKSGVRHQVDPQIDLLFGDPVGWWEGDTLIVETTQFHPLQLRSMVPLTKAGRVLERFTRVSANQLLYEFTVDDPTLYTRRWRGEMSFNASDSQLYEYACHEGNYAMTGILSGAREQEKRERQ